MQSSDHNRTFAVAIAIMIAAIALAVAVALISGFRNNHSHQQALSDCAAASTGLRSSLTALDSAQASGRTLLDQLQDSAQQSSSVQDSKSDLTDSVQSADQVKANAQRWANNCDSSQTAEELITYTGNVKQQQQMVTSSTKAVMAATAKTQVARTSAAASQTLVGAKAQLQDEIGKAQTWLNSEEGQRSKQQVRQTARSLLDSASQLVQHSGITDPNTYITMANELKALLATV